MAVQSFLNIVGVSPSSASPSNSTLVIIDAQNEYSEGKLKVTNAPQSRKAIAALLKRYRDAGGKVIHVVHKTPQGAPVFTPDTKLAEEYEELTPKSGEKVIGKNHPSSFADTDLQEYLGSEAGTKVVLAGYMAHVCVSTTARDAARFGYDVIVAEDCVGDRDIPGVSGDDLTKIVMHELADAFATVVQSSDIK
ncbi:hypothetical protein Q7P37_009514 [Cladosporium fusiforme]